MNLHTRLRLNARLLKALYLAILLRTTVVFLVLPPLDRAPNITMWCLAMLPLLACFYGVFWEKRRHILGLCYVCIPYFMAVGANLFVSDLLWYTLSGVVLFSAVFSSALLYVKWHVAAENA